MQIKDIQENKELDNIIDNQIDYLYHQLLTEINQHGMRNHKYTILKQKELTKKIVEHIILTSKLMEII